VFAQKEKRKLQECVMSAHKHFYSISIFTSAEKGTGVLACSNPRQTLSLDHLEIISPAEPAKAQSRSSVYNSVITTGPLELHG